jgi:DNA polymerase I-like protein with 3'-5' exonuclease and polymerase domains
MIVFDIETDNLLDMVTKIHCLSYHNLNTNESVSITDYGHIKNFILAQKTLIGHNIIKYDIPVLEKLLDIKIEATCIDTLALSWYLQPYRLKHGLEGYGVEFGLPKPVVTDWKNLTIQEYIHRCQEDVKINTILFKIQNRYLDTLYTQKGNKQDLIGYLSFKMNCLRDQETSGIHINKYLCETTKYNLETIINDKIDKLSLYMPRQVEKTAPKRMYKKDGNTTNKGEKWLEELDEKRLPLDSTVIYQKGNPGSTKQLKTWLYNLGWKPHTHKLSKSTGKMVEQITLPFGEGICSSVKSLYDKYPMLKELEGLYIAQHRLGVIKSMLDNTVEGKIYSKAHGFTNTLRLCHSKPLVNLVSVSKLYGKEIRGCLIAPENWLLCGSDISGLEDSTKMHYMYFFDPEYVVKMQVPGFDPHLDIGVFANLLTEEEVVFYKNYNKDVASEIDTVQYKKIKEVRATSKMVNFACIYGAGGAKIADSLKITLEEATVLHKAYWKRNAAVKKVANAITVQIIGDQKWAYNPVSKFWYFLKTDKDKFSTINQSSGDYVFNLWLKYVKKSIVQLGYNIVYQCHDKFCCE